jgi:hypothetical protein
MSRAVSPLARVQATYNSSPWRPPSSSEFSGGCAGETGPRLPNAHRSPIRLAWASRSAISTAALAIICLGIVAIRWAGNRISVPATETQSVSWEPAAQEGSLHQRVSEATRKRRQKRSSAAMRWSNQEVKIQAIYSGRQKASAEGSDTLQRRRLQLKQWR